MSETKHTTGRLVMAFAAVYLIWGSTYLAIRYAIQTLPPLWMATARFLAGGLILYGLSRLRGEPRPTAGGWKHAAVLGFMLILCGNGAVVVAEQWVPSGLTAVIVSTVSVWVAIFSWLRPGGRRPTVQVAVGIVVGLAGVVMLIGVGTIRGAGRVDPAGAIILLVSTMSWAAGSLYSQRVQVAASPLQASGMQMISGGVFLALAGGLAGEASQLNLAGISTVSILALAYLTIFGSVIAFTAYNWLLKATTPARASTYAYVNPAVAVLLGWAIAGEPITPRIIMSMVVIVAAVTIITMARRQTA